MWTAHHITCCPEYDWPVCRQASGEQKASCTIQVGACELCIRRLSSEPTLWLTFLP